ncbi:MAG TPA: GNAT family N-acetyltransferase [Candidatus Saccharimonadales bacterium]|nr:GNAT family N-acetyltransferase [Candidatus Saccharimonadales bacterium]
MNSLTTCSEVLPPWDSSESALSAAGLIVGQIPAFSDIYSGPEDYLKKRDPDYYSMYVLTEQDLGLIAASLVIHNELDVHNGLYTRISAFVVDRTNRGKNHGRELIQFIAAQTILRHDPTIVVAPAKRSIGFYRRVGFSKNAQWRGDFDATPQAVLAH